ncbi:MAG: hypothetical protein V4667_05440 [Bacteroidota bacterium]
MMKKLLFICLGTLIIVSCSKDVKINKELQGTWNVTTWADSSVSTGLVKMEFAKTTKKEGTGVITLTQSIISVTQEYTYSLSNQKFTINAPEKTIVILGVFPYTIPAFNATCSVLEHSKTKFVVSDDSNGKDYVLVK